MGVGDLSKAAEYEEMLLDQIKHAVVFFDEEEMKSSVSRWTGACFDPSKAIFSGLVPGMEEVGKLYEDQVYFIPELLLCAEVLYKGLEMLKAQIEKKAVPSKGKVLIGVVYGDIHDIGKNIVKMMLEIYGFSICDLGRDVPAENFKNKLIELEPDIICLSAMMTTTMFEMRKIIRTLREKKPDIKVMVGGAPFTETIAKRWGANGYGKDAHHALKAAISIIKQIAPDPQTQG